MALRPKYGSSEEVVRWYRGKIKRVEETQRHVVQDAMEYGASLMREFIETRGTGRTWSRPWYGREGSYPGRVHTGGMLNAVTTRLVVDSAGRTQGHFGWLDQREDYFRYQEGGFQHKMAGHYVEGMYAMVDSAEEAFRYLQEELDRGIRGA